MKKIVLFCILMTLAMTMGSCKKGVTGASHIHGTVTNAELNGKRIFLVPLYGPQDAGHVDSIVIKDNQFEFATDTVMMAKILVDYHFRLNVQPLLIITEPGNIHVTIGETSSAGGTQQNDQMQTWKNNTEVHNKKMGELRKLLNTATDETQKAALKNRMDSIHLAHKQYTRQLCDKQQPGILRDFLSTLYPLTYKRKLPDGSIVTVNADTKEIVKEN